MPFFMWHFHLFFVRATCRQNSLQSSHDATQPPPNHIAVTGDLFGPYTTGHYHWPVQSVVVCVWQLLLESADTEEASVVASARGMRPATMGDQRDAEECSAFVINSSVCT